MILLSISGLGMYWFLRRKNNSDDEVNLVGNMERGNSSPQAGKTLKNFSVANEVVFYSQLKFLLELRCSVG